MSLPTDRASWRAVFVFGLASLLTIALGAVVMAQGDVPFGIWIRNPVAWLIAGALSLFLASRGWLGAAMAPIALIVVALSPLLLRKSAPAALALAAYFAATSLAFVLGAYPVPLAGYGLSFVIGWWLGFACLSARRTP